MGFRVYAKRLALPCLLLLACVLRPAIAGQPDDVLRLGGYELGRGLALGDSGFTLGGYATARAEDTDRADPRAAFSHLSLMLWWQGSGRFRFFTEADLEDAFATRRPRVEDERFLALERFYGDYAFSDAITVRAGKFLTPIGRWNQIHADPLVWTTSRPLVTDAVFPGTATGAMLFGTLPIADREVEYAVFQALGTEWRRKPAEDPFSEARGLRLNVPLDSALQIGLSLAGFEQEGRRDERKHLFGLDFMWRRAGRELSGEAVYRDSSEGAEQVEKGGFLQAVMPLGGRLYGVGRIESLRVAGSGAASRIAVIGLNYRYARAISLKAEWLRGSRLPDGVSQGVLASVSVLF